MPGCTECPSDSAVDSASDTVFRWALWIALLANFAMFVVEMVASHLGDSMSLQADALDFLGDSANYGISLFVVGMALTTRAKASLFKGATMALFGTWVIGSAVYRAIEGSTPDPSTMGMVAVVALAVNVAVAVLLYRYPTDCVLHEPKAVPRRRGSRTLPWNIAGARVGSSVLVAGRHSALCRFRWQTHAVWRCNRCSIHLAGGGGDCQQRALTRCVSADRCADVPASGAGDGHSGHMAWHCGVDRICRYGGNWPGRPATPRGPHGVGILALVTAAPVRQAPS